VVLATNYSAYTLEISPQRGRSSAAELDALEVCDHHDLKPSHREMRLERDRLAPIAPEPDRFGVDHDRVLLPKLA
jgi:hypothetical protein